MMRPIPGQPGLFRDERRTALSDFSVPPPATGYTWDVPRGRPWVLGEIPQSLRDQARANAQRLASLKTAADPLVREVPWRTDAYSSLVRRVTTSPRGAILQITRADLGLLVRGVISQVSQSQILSDGLLANPRATSAQIERARRLLFSAKDIMVQLERMLAAARPLTGRSSQGLGELGVWEFALAAVVLLVAAVLVYALVSSMQLNVTAIAEAREACRLDAEAGQPCSGADYQAYLQAALAQQRENGAVPNLSDLFSSASSLLFWGGLLAVAGLLGYAAWAAEPARRQFAARFQGLSAGHQRSTYRRRRS